MPNKASSAGNKRKYHHKPIPFTCSGVVSGLFNDYLLIQKITVSSGSDFAVLLRPSKLANLCNSGC